MRSRLGSCGRGVTLAGYIGSGGFPVCGVSLGATVSLVLPLLRDGDPQREGVGSKCLCLCRGRGLGLGEVDQADAS